MKKFDTLVESVLSENKSPKDKFIKQLSDPKIWDYIKEAMDEDYKKDYKKYGEEWVTGITWSIPRKVKSVYNLNPKDMKIVQSLVNVYAYELETQGLQ